MKCMDVMKKLEELSPLSYAAGWDNVGLLAGNPEKEIGSVYVALDATDGVIEAAVAAGADMLLTHHPMIFSPLKRVRQDDFIGRRLIRLIQNDMCYYAMHTNFDVMGMADAAADEMELQERQVLEVTYEDEISKEGFGRYGSLPRSMTLAECAAQVKKSFGIDHVKVFGDLNGELLTAAIAPGSGKSMLNAALSVGVDVIITGDIDHHEGIDAVARGLSVIDAGHQGIEQIFIPYMTAFLKRELGSLCVYAEPCVSPFRIL